MIDMVNGSIIPACVDYQNELAKLLRRKKDCGNFESTLEERMLGKISKNSTTLSNKLDALEELMTHTDHDLETHAKFCRDQVLVAMAELRTAVDALEICMARKHWPFPSYSDLLFSVL